MQIAHVDPGGNVDRDLVAAIREALSNAGYRLADEEPGSAPTALVHVSTRPPGPINDLRPTRHGSLASDDAGRLESVAVLAGGVAHDFNNILSVISICTDELSDRVALGELPGGGVTEPTVVSECFDDIRHAIDRGAALTRDLLAFSRRDVPEPRLVDMNELITSSRTMIERLVGDSIAVDVSLGHLGGFVDLDPSQWASVFVNLTLNARHAMPSGGTLSIRTRTATIDPKVFGRDKPQGDYVEVLVSDTGCGIPEDVLPKIFDPFFTTHGFGRGTGLGLSVVHGIVERSRGFVDVVSKVGVGSTFRAFVPLKRASTTDPPISSSRRSSKSSSLLLLVEDESAVRRIAHRILEREGYRVLPAESAEEALALLDRDGVVPTLLVTDIVLPGIDGKALGDILRTRFPELPILYTSGYTDHDLPITNELGFLQKPYTGQLLTKRVEELLLQTGAEDDDG